MTKKKFKPFLEDVPLSYALEHEEYRNKSREKSWGFPVFFFSPDIPVGSYGTPGPYYLENHSCKEGQGRYGNCTWYFGARHLETSGEVIKAVIGKAVDTFKKYNGRKSGGDFKGIKLGNLLQPGDGLIFAEDKELKENGHINRCEAIDYETQEAIVSESGYSTNSLYKDKTCIVYRIKLSDLVTGKTVTLRPKSPYKEMFYGIIHTGDCFEQEENPLNPVERNEKVDQLQVISKAVNIRKGSGVKYDSFGYAEPGYYNIYQIRANAEDGYNWCQINKEKDAWIAVISNATYGDSTKVLPKKEEQKEDTSEIDILKEQIKTLEIELSEAQNTLNDFEKRLSDIATIANGVKHD